MIDVRHLPGNIEDIVRKPAEQLTGHENVTGYWTISSSWPKTGELLVEKLADVLPEGHIEHTISPIRDFYKIVNRDEVLAMPEDEIRLKVLDYLMNRPDGVKEFHLGNGAYVGWIHVNPTYKKDWIIVNYMYDRTKLAQNKSVFKDNANPMTPLSGALYGVLPPKMLGRAYHVDHQTMVALPQPKVA